VQLYYWIVAIHHVNLVQTATGFSDRIRGIASFCESARKLKSMD